MISLLGNTNNVPATTHRPFKSKSKRWIFAQLKRSVPVAHATNMKGSYENMKLVSEEIEISMHFWKIYGNLKVIDILLSLQLGHAKYCCQCEWDRRDVKNIIPKTIGQNVDYLLLDKRILSFHLWQNQKMYFCHHYT